MIADQHLHLERGPYTPENYPDAWLDRFLETAANAAVHRLGVVEHAYRFHEARGLLPGPWADARCLYRLDDYVTFVERSKARGLPVSFGLEMDYVPGAEEGIERFLSLYPWDFVHGSVHFVGDVGIDLAEHRAAAAQIGPKRIWERYFALSRNAAESGLFDVLTHPDLPKIFGERADHPLDEEFHMTVTTLRRQGMAIECNTAGLRKPVGEIYPVPAYLAAAFKAGVPVSIGSDAHEPENVGAGFPEGIALLRSVGYGETVHFIGRERFASPLS
ncbi:MAG: histidinol-phosphatase HisJ family protein [Thermaerobacter sp.]|nr:histidinol-phosphatase HisJ family protein [Thermaerobacter sp.]